MEKSNLKKSPSITAGSLEMDTPSTTLTASLETPAKDEASQSPRTVTASPPSGPENSKESNCDVVNILNTLICGKGATTENELVDTNRPLSPSALSDESAFAILSTADRSHLAAFVRVLAQGIVMTLHTSTGPKEIKINLSGEELRWHYLSDREVKGRKKFKIYLGDIVAGICV